MVLLPMYTYINNPGQGFLAVSEFYVNGIILHIFLC